MSKRFMICIFFAAVVLQVAVYAIWNFSNPPPATEVRSITPEVGKSIAEGAQKFTENNSSLALAAVGGVAATLFAIFEKFVLTRQRQVYVVVAISFFSGSLFFGYLASGALIRELSETGIVEVDKGDFHIVSSMQFFTLLLGALCYAMLMIDLISQPAAGVTTPKV